MNNFTIEDILNQIDQGKRCYFGSDDDEISTMSTIELDRNGLYEYRSTVSLNHDVVAPVQYQNKLLNKTDLREVLGKIPDDLVQTVSYADTRMINEKTRDAADLIFSRLKQRPRIGYIVLKSDRHRTGNPRDMYFNGLYKTRQQAEAMVDYLKTKQGAESSWKELTLSLKDGELEIQGNLSSSEHVNSQQILATLLDIGVSGLEKFFGD